MKAFLFLFVAVLFMVMNIAAACYAAIRLGYGPPNWQSALNLIVRLTTLQNCLNAGRDWLDEKAPWAEKYLNRLGIPKPIIIVDTTPEEEEPEEEEINEAEKNNGEKNNGEEEKEQDGEEQDEEEKDENDKEEKGEANEEEEQDEE